MPGDAARGGAAGDDLGADERVDVVDGVDLRRRDVGPAGAERRHPALHLAQHEPRLLGDRRGAGVAAADEVVAIVSLDRKSVVWGKSVSVRVDLGGSRIIKQNIKQSRMESMTTEETKYNCYVPSNE